MSKRKPLDGRTLCYVGRELIQLAEAFYKAPGLPEYKAKDRTRGDILSAHGRIYLREGNRLTRQALPKPKAKRKGSERKKS